ncbi:hemin-binding protein [Prevotella sp. E15-22]|uniref:hemin-binding protein n=1 Tax=Prevotella sp. E15-22 TaxID=2937774 RepID=UPI002048A077|nr:hemin-binding protein [Prevotella sp. E15-22]UPS44686.1 hemin-binding protein [Prevotella sp. E15-22]
MKKLFTFFSLCLLTLSAAAQQYVFTDKNGNVLEDGVTITCTEAEDDGFGGISLLPGISVKNVSANEGSQLAIEATITKIDNGSLQLCFPTNCQVYNTTGTYEPSEKATLATGQTKSIQTEWVPESYGECIVTYKAMDYQGFAGSVCRTLTVNYKYAESNVQQNWWGYVNNDTEKAGLGVRATDTYHCAIFIPGNHAVAAGKTIKAVRFGLVAQNATDTKVWLASSLPSAINESNTLQIVNVPDSKIGSDNIEVDLTPYAIPEGGVYVGYSFTIVKANTQNDQYPILTTGSDAPNALIIRTDQAVTQWSDMYGQGFGSLFLQVLLEGEFADNTATAADFGPLYTILGESTTANVAITNAGGTALSSIDYTITTDGVPSAEQHVNLTAPIQFNATGTISITIPADATAGSKVKTFNITKVNGNANSKADVGAKFTLYTLPELVNRNVVVEEFTGTACGWCPRGLIGMENLRKAYGDRFVGIGLHQYNSSDAMYIAPNAYASISFEGAPSCRINRGAEMDPYYGTNESILDDFAAEMAVPALAKVNVSGTADADLTTVEAKAEVEALVDNSKFTLEFVVIGDGLTGTGSAWNQANYYYQYNASQLPADLSIFGTGGKHGKSSITGWVFNDVALCSSYVGGSNKAPALGNLAAGEKKEVEYTLTLPVKTTLKNALQSDQLYVIALVVDQNKKIANAAKTKIEVADPSGIETIETASSQVEGFYTLDGKRLSAPVKGMNVIKMSNGTTRKVVIR